MKFKFPSIRHFHEVLKEYRKLKIFNEVKLVGYPKIHGSNANICFHEDGSITAHSKILMLDPQDNMMGFWFWMDDNREVLSKIGKILKQSCPSLQYPFVLCGEWAGEKIQGKASTAGIPKFWTVFATGNVVEETDDMGVLGNHIQFVPLPKQHLHLKDINLYDIRMFGKYEITLDVSFPERAQNALAEFTVQAEKECPIAKMFGVTSDKGEGVVWHVEDNADRHLYFKVKGKKHTTAKVRTLASVNPERIANILEFVEYACTENRMLQAVSETGPLDKSNLGKFMKWVHADIVKEETSTLEANDMEYRVVQDRISTKALAWYQSQY